MKTEVGILTVILMLMAMSPGSVTAQVTNGDFSSAMNGWTLYFPPGNHFPPDYGIVSIDIDGPGPLDTTEAFAANVGSDALVDLKQAVFLAAGVKYNLRANLAATSAGNNADGGTVSAYVGSTLLASYSFGGVGVGSIHYASLAGSYSPAVSGLQTLSINFSRGFGVGLGWQTPVDYIDNVTLSPVLIPLNIQTSGDKVILTWTNSAYGLQASPLITGTFTNLPGATSPYTNTIAGSQKYFRLLAN